MYVVLLLAGLLCAHAASPRLRPASSGLPFHRGLDVHMRHISRDAPPKRVSASRYETFWFENQLDHFNPLDNRTWSQRYWINDTFWNAHKGGPVYIQLGGEQMSDPDYLFEGMFGEWAAEEKALLVILEHRFYGESHPTEDLSLSNLVYLSSEQALEDAAHFVSHLKNTLYPKTKKVIAFGASYAGMLAAWFRLKYPNLVDGALSSSGPVRVVENLVSYLEATDKAIRSYPGGKTCSRKIKEASLELEALLATASGQDVVHNLFPTCTVPRTEIDIQYFVSNVILNWQSAVQYNLIIPGYPGITELCDIMADETRPPLENYAAVSQLFLGDSCVHTAYDELVAMYSDETWWSSDSVGYRQWTYQYCTEFGFFQTTDSPDQPFGNLVPLAFYHRWCSDLFGQASPRVKTALVRYGGDNPRSTNVIFSNGSIDPWHTIGLLKAKSAGLYPVFIKGTAHCADLDSPRPDSPPDLVRAQRRIGDLLHRFVHD